MQTVCVNSVERCCISIKCQRMTLSFLKKAYLVLPSSTSLTYSDLAILYLCLPYLPLHYLPYISFITPLHHTTTTLHSTALYCTACTTLHYKQSLHYTTLQYTLQGRRDKRTDGRTDGKDNIRVQNSDNIKLVL